MNQQELENVLSSLDGWCSTEKARALCNLVEEIKPKLILELGVFGGRSLVPMAITQKNIQCGISVGIDHWSYQSSLEGDDIGDDVEYWKNLNYQSIMYECISETEFAPQLPEKVFIPNYLITEKGISNGVSNC